MTRTPAEIAAALTPAMRRAFLWLREDFEPRVLLYWCKDAPAKATLNRLVQRGLASVWTADEWPPAYSMANKQDCTAVRAVLAAQEKESAP